MRQFWVIIAMFGFLFNNSQASIELNDAVPAITSVNQDGETVDLATLGSEGYLLVYFYPKADTPGCTKQACSLRDAYEELIKAEVKVVGVSTDSVADQKKFAEKFDLPFMLLADKSAEVVKGFGVPSMGAFAKRQAFLFRDGKLVWKDEKASTSQQAQDVLEVIKNQAS